MDILDKIGTAEIQAGIEKRIVTLTKSLPKLQKQQELSHQWKSEISEITWLKY
ncbi:MAG TPA: hypothetical protein VE130_03870 [Nitrososphaeraceae archaeon]|nr:hypothetical protein [Nitrososphaeraceae archaeon]